MPGSLVEFAGARGPCDRDDTSDKVGRASENKRDGLIEAQCLDGGGEEILEAIGRQVHMLHECEEPEFGIASGVFEACKGGCAGFAADGVALDAVMGELALFWGEPLGGEGVVWKCEGGTYSNNEGGDTLQYSLSVSDNACLP